MGRRRSPFIVTIAAVSLACSQSEPSDDDKSVDSPTADAAADTDTDVDVDTDTDVDVDTDTDADTGWVVGGTGRPTAGTNDSTLTNPPPDSGSGLSWVPTSSHGGSVPPLSTPIGCNPPPDGSVPPRSGGSAGPPTDTGTP